MCRTTSSLPHVGFIGLGIPRFRKAVLPFAATQPRLRTRFISCCSVSESPHVSPTIVRPLQAQASALSACPVRRDLQYIMEPVEECENVTIKFSGRIPSDLIGTMFRVMPGNFSAGTSQPYTSFLDGDGHVMRVTFLGEDQFASVSTKFIATEGFVSEQKAGKLLHRTVFGTQRSGGWVRNALDVRLKNTANTGIVYWKGELLALWEGGRPHALSPHTLETFGQFDLNGALSPGIPYEAGVAAPQALSSLFGFGGDTWSGHPKIDEKRRTLINFGYRLRTCGAVLKVYEWGAETEVSHFDLNCLPMIFHDFAVSPSYFAFIEYSVRLKSSFSFVSGQKCAFELFQYDEKKSSKIYLLPRKHSKKPAKPIVVKCEPCFGFHHVCLDELSNGDVRLTTLVMDTSASEGNPSLQTWDFFNMPSHLSTITFSPDSTGDRVGRIERLSKVPVEFPVLCNDGINGKRQYGFFGVCDARSKARGVPRGYGKFDLRTGQLLDAWIPTGRCFVGEAVFIPREGAQVEDDGYLIGFRHAVDVGETIIDIFDAHNLSAGPRASGSMPKLYPLGLHSSWSPQVFAS